MYLVQKHMEQNSARPLIEGRGSVLFTVELPPNLVLNLYKEWGHPCSITSTGAWQKGGTEWTFAEWIMTAAQLFNMYLIQWRAFALFPGLSWWCFIIFRNITLFLFSSFIVLRSNYMPAHYKVFYMSVHLNLMISSFIFKILEKKDLWDNKIKTKCNNKYFKNQQNAMQFSRSVQSAQMEKPKYEGSKT